MWFLTIVVYILVHGPAGHKPKTEHYTAQLAYDTRHTCEHAEGRLDPNVILNTINSTYKLKKKRKWAMKVEAECLPETNGMPTDGFENRMYRP